MLCMLDLHSQRLIQSITTMSLALTSIAIFSGKEKTSVSPKTVTY